MFSRGDTIRGAAGAYVVDDVVGEGGFGITYRATLSPGDTPVAVKVMRIERLESWKALELFEREAKALRALQHDRIPAYIEFFAETSAGPVALDSTAHDEAPTAIVLVQEFVAGADLDRQRRDGRVFTRGQVASIIRQTLEILSYLHGLHPPIVHRDVNPRNLIVNDDLDVFLVDFGAIQQRLREQTVGGSTAVGTLGFTPIEQSMGKARPASDLYALGITALVLMTGLGPADLPLDDETSKVDLASLGLTPAAQDDEQNRRLCHFIERAVEPIVGRRLQTAAEGLAIFDDSGALVLADLGQVAATNDGTTALARPQGAWRRTLFLLCLGGSLGGAGIIYPLGFDNFSETEMVQLAPVWVLPAAFGAIGLVVQNTPRPLLTAAIGTFVAAGFLVCFFAAIFPAL